MFLGIFGGWVIGLTSTIFSDVEYMEGLQLEFDPFLIKYALIKTLVFAFLLPQFHPTKGTT